jgi:hypothetical protein
VVARDSVKDWGDEPLPYERPGKLEALDNWGVKLAEAFKKEFGPNY